ncbi:hypothetical protein HPB47_000409 [Ixodes persulcatus]|uniref:Uncharacterized protein n=1 Tax=Ixodes persulcatus TaxID=34615 RepID=A0AC60PRT8_IXOPE|nr:hypothetical protein HPB47_000409 [Ixodes persulcatus]
MPKKLVANLSAWWLAQLKSHPHAHADTDTQLVQRLPREPSSPKLPHEPPVGASACFGRREPGARAALVIVGPNAKVGNGVLAGGATAAAKKQQTTEKRP